MSPSRKFTFEEARQIGDKIGADFNVIDLQEFCDGLSIELEHGARDPQTDVTHDDLTMTGKIALAHLKEFPDYYTRLEKLEQEADAYWQAKRLVTP
jgi:hypothetical protein